MIPKKHGARNTIHYKCQRKLKDVIKSIKINDKIEKGLAKT